MQCTKCDGLMVTAQFSDYYQLCYEWRCLNCGSIVFPPSIDLAPALEAKARLSFSRGQRAYRHRRVSQIR